MPTHLLKGNDRFRREYFPRYRDHYERLVAEGQSPSALLISCCDSRVEPDLLTDSLPGELFITRNIGNFVPPFEDDTGLHGTSAAIEYAVLILGVADIIVCGHSHCGAIKALYGAPNAGTPHINRWLELGRAAMADSDPTPEVLRETERRSIGLQLSRLMNFPMVAERVESGTLCLHGWYFVIEEGRLLVLDFEEGKFVPYGEPVTR